MLRGAFGLVGFVSRYVAQFYMSTYTVIPRGKQGLVKKISVFSSTEEAGKHFCHSPVQVTSSMTGHD